MLTKPIRSFSTFCYLTLLTLFLCSCNLSPKTNPTQTNASPTSIPASPTPIKVETSCPTPNTTRAAIMPPLPNRGQQQALVYKWNQQVDNNTFKAGIIRNYNPTTQSKTDIVKIDNESIGTVFFSNDGTWLLFTTTLNGTPVNNLPISRTAIRLIRIDGQFSQTLYCSEAKPKYDESILGWSPDQKSIILETIDSTQQFRIRKILTISTQNAGKPQHVGMAGEWNFHGWINNTQFAVSTKGVVIDYKPELVLFDITNTNSNYFGQTLYTLPNSCSSEAIAQSGLLFVNECPTIPSPNEQILNTTIRQISPSDGKSTIATNNRRIEYPTRPLNAMCMPDTHTILWRTKDTFWTLNVDTNSTPTQPTQLAQGPISLTPNTFDNCPYVSRDGNLFFTHIQTQYNASTLLYSIYIATIPNGNQTLVAEGSPTDAVYAIGWTTL